MNTKKTQTASVRLYKRLKQDIVTCALKPGSSFSEVELARRYKVSRTPVREVCRQLQNEGLITIEPYRGYSVAALTVAEFHNLQEMQLIVDSAAAALASERATAIQIQEMESAAKYEYKIGVKSSYYSFLQRNMALHVGIAEASGNRELVVSVASIHTRLMRYFYLGLTLDSYGPQLVAEHMGIVKAIRERNTDKARHKTAQHILNTMKRSASLFVASALGQGKTLNEAGITASEFQYAVEVEQNQQINGKWLKPSRG
jgi:DNA-binding GntR family transcriptional regulator